MQLGSMAGASRCFRRLWLVLAAACVVHNTVRFRAEQRRTGRA